MGPQETFIYGLGALDNQKVVNHSVLLISTFLVSSPFFQQKNNSIPLGAGTVTIFPTEQTNMHLVLQVVALQSDLTITRHLDVALTVVRTIATIQEVTILQTVRLQARGRNPLCALVCLCVLYPSAPASPPVSVPIQIN